MENNILLTIIEFVMSIIVEGIILAGIFSHISNRIQQKDQAFLQNEMANIEVQNKFIFEQLQKEIRESKHEIINQIKESAAPSKE